MLTIHTISGARILIEQTAENTIYTLGDAEPVTYPFSGAQHELWDAIVDFATAEGGFCHPAAAFRDLMNVTTTMVGERVKARLEVQLNRLASREHRDQLVASWIYAALGEDQPDEVTNQEALAIVEEELGRLSEGDETFDALVPEQDYIGYVDVTVRVPLTTRARGESRARQECQDIVDEIEREGRSVDIGAYDGDVVAASLEEVELA